MAGIEDKLAAIEAAAAKQTGADCDDGMTDVNLDVDQLNEMTTKELSALAAGMGLEVKKNMKKADLVAMIAAETVQVPEEAIEEGEAGDPAAAEPEDDTEDDRDGEGMEETEEKPDVEMVQGRVLVTYTGMVNLRDGDLKVVGQAMQGQTFAAICKRVDKTGTWYMIEDQVGKPFFISADVVRLMV